MIKFTYITDSGKEYDGEIEDGVITTPGDMSEYDHTSLLIELENNRWREYLKK